MALIIGEGGNRKRRKEETTALQTAEESTEISSAASYFFKDGMRHVRPYIYSFQTRAKGRWFGRHLLEIFEAEFRTYDPCYYAKSIREGTITVNEKKVDPLYIVKNGDLLVHQCHRHEPPVLGESIPVISEDEELIVVSKPPTVPIHPCGAYKHNCLVSILSSERTHLLNKLFLIYRLDRLTSGLTIMAKSSKVASRLSEQLRGGQTKKYYLAIVEGLFSAEALRATEGVIEGKRVSSSEILFNAWCTDDPETVRGTREGERVDPDSGRVSKKHRQDQGQNGEGNVQAAAMCWSVQSDGSIKVEAGIRCLSHRDGIYEVHPDGKPSITIFRLRGVDGQGRALLECRPITGRTHQIRLHLQWLGFPILNDPNYGPEASVAAFRQKWQDEEEQATALFTTPSTAVAVKDGGNGEPEAVDGESEEDKIKRLCPYCVLGDSCCFKEIQLHHKGIYLHAWRYQGRDWSYETPLPAWCKGFVAS